MMLYMCRMPSPDKEDDEEGDSEEQHPNVEDSEGRSGSLGPRS